MKKLSLSSGGLDLLVADRYVAYASFSPRLVTEVEGPLKLMPWLVSAMYAGIDENFPMDRARRTRNTTAKTRAVRSAPCHSMFAIESELKNYPHCLGMGRKVPSCILVSHAGNFI